MNEFINALACQQRNELIPEEDDFFGALIGEWNFEWVDQYDKETPRHVTGEWIFSWVLEGCAIQDVFICPSRKERKSDIQPDAEYGTTIRIYNARNRTWDIVYGCSAEMTRLEARRENEKIVLTEITNQQMKWIFSDITENSFHWQRIVWSNEEKEWKIGADLSAKRKTK